MNYRITEGLKKNKIAIIIGLVLWIFLTIVLVLPFTVSSNLANGDSSKFFEIFSKRAIFVNAV